MGTNFSVNVEKHTSLEINGDEGLVSYTIELIKEKNGKNDIVYVEQVSSFDEVINYELDNPVNFMHQLSNYNELGWLPEFVGAGEYDFAGKKVNIELKDLLEFCHKYYYLQENDKEWIIRLMKPYIEKFQSESKLDELIFNLLKVSLNDESTAEDIIQSFEV
ncbi:hypothetical protein CWO92_24705 [Heyndrickxia camelliae]|uniref:Uncharacterized protein n=2 Tax=Heyndrickxia camelliae TaxID=1707093 RepID=A0A2N3LCK9_9BACI|nr:hypothetical protein CWO92_24705 [Heyndrickxia camelliae]